MAAPRTLSPATVLAMREAAAAGESAASLARRYGVGCTTAERIVRGETYRDLGGPTSPPRRKPKALDPVTVAEIRTERARGRSVADIARQYGITRQACDRIVRGITYPDAPGPIVARSNLPSRAARVTILAAALLTRQRGGFTAADLAERAGISHNAADKRIERMIARGWMAPDRCNRSRFTLTDEGRAFCVRVLADHQPQEKG